MEAASDAGLNGKEQDKYIPGVCNIGKSETRVRRKQGWVGLISAVILYILLVFLDIPHAWRLVLFIPSTIAAIGFLQAHMHFCAYFGMVGLFNFSDRIGKNDTVEQAEFRAMDRKKAWKIIIYSVLIGTAAAFSAYYLPL